MRASNNLHVWQCCGNCKSQPELGKCYECQTSPLGPQRYLCEDCYKLYQKGKIKHPGEDSFSPIKGFHEFVRSLPATPQSNPDWLAVSLPNTDAPKTRSVCLIRPEFITKNFTCIAGYGFLIEFDNRVILLTALHVLDPLIKHFKINCSVTNQKYSGKELTHIIGKVNLYDVLKQRWAINQVASCSEMLVLPYARVDAEEPDASLDIAAFNVPKNDNLSPLVLASRAPKVGDVIWLHILKEDDQHLLPAVVVECTNQTLIFRFDEILGAEPKYTSGAPLLNRFGEVIGINIGAGSYDGQRFGHANHVGNIHYHLNTHFHELLPSKSVDTQFVLQGEKA